MSFFTSARFCKYVDRMPEMSPDTSLLDHCTNSYHKFDYILTGVSLLNSWQALVKPPMTCQYGRHKLEMVVSSWFMLLWFPWPTHRFYLEEISYVTNSEQMVFMIYIKLDFWPCRALAAAYVCCSGGVTTWLLQSLFLMAGEWSLTSWQRILASGFSFGVIQIPTNAFLAKFAS